MNRFLEWFSRYRKETYDLKNEVVNIILGDQITFLRQLNDGIFIGNIRFYKNTFKNLKVFIPKEYGKHFHSGVFEQCKTNNVHVAFIDRWKIKNEKLYIYFKKGVIKREWKF
ncbi:MAG: hypothetical protein ACFFG0_02345 [Candidatus Thorarchaeota archaeon]